LCFAGLNVKAGGKKTFEILDFRLKLKDFRLNTPIRIGLGLAALGRPGYINIGHSKDLEDYNPEEMEKHAHAVLDLAWERGVRYFDAARSYGLAEKFLGPWLRNKMIDPKDVIVASKWGYTYTANWKVNADKHEVKDHSIERLLTQWHESDSILGEYLDIYNIHSATKESGVLENKEVLEQLFELSQQKVVIGLTVSGKDQAETVQQALEIQFDGVPLFQCVQATWNILEQSTTAVLQKAHGNGTGIVIKEALANGRLTDRNNDPGFAAKRKILEREAVRLKTSIDALSIAAILVQPWADIVLSGASTADQLISNLQALEVQVDENTLTTLLSLAEQPAEYWSYRSKLPWN
jgi:aryl-alcohol dehydrogenase-like predicted oxidoreductase